MSEQSTEAGAAPTTAGAPAPAAPAAPVRIRERRFNPEGMGGGHFQERVRELAPGEALPDGVQIVEDGAEPGDWQAVQEG